jgi:hypothetical protein
MDEGDVAEGLLLVCPVLVWPVLVVSWATTHVAHNKSTDNNVVFAFM